MLSMIIIDDELLTINKITEFIPFDALDIRLDALCENGLEGLDHIKMHFPDIILCDITMPKMTGFELLEQLKEFPEYRPQVIMLTGHNDFAHTRQAIKYQVLDYLLKPIMPDELISALTRAAGLAREEKALNSVSHSNNSVIIKSAFTEKLFSGNFLNNDELVRDCKKIGVTLDSPYYIAVLLLIKGTVTDSELNTIKHNIRAAFSKEFPECLYGTFSAEGSKFLIPVSNADESIAEKCSLILSSLSRPDTFLCISNTCTDLSELPVLQTQLEYCNSFTFCFDEGRILEYTKISNYMEKNFEKNILPSLNAETKNIKVKSIKNSHALLERFSKILQNAEYYDSSYVKVFIYQIMDEILLNIIPAIEDTAAEDDDEEEEYRDPLWKRISAAETLSSLLELCHNIIDKYKPISESSVSERNKFLCEQMKNYVHHNYMNTVTLIMLSKEFYLTASYLRKLFLTENGISFKQYLKQYRMEKAKELILTNKYKIYEVALKVGYNDIKSFRTAFVEYFGVSPSQIAPDCSEQ